MSLMGAEPCGDGGHWLHVPYELSVRKMIGQAVVRHRTLLCTPPTIL